VKLLLRAYDALIFAMAGFAGVLMAGMFAAIVVDVALRNLGWQSSAHLFTFTEYALLMVPCFGAPWLVREKGHVFVEIVINALRPAARRRMLLVIGLACIVVCLVLAWYGVQVSLRNFELDDKDVRSFDAPRWALVACIPLGFFFMATEFARHLLRGEDFLGSMDLAPALPDTVKGDATAERTR
jgi:TRAP-type C4-dicarboxylate transport system permease small subunit